MSIELIIAFITASSLISLSPGADNIFVLTQSALYGCKSGLMVTLGLCTGLIAHTLAIALGVSALFQASPTAFTALKIIGAIYLLYLAWRAFTASKAEMSTSSSTVRSAKKLYLRGILMNVTNPKVSIFFLAFLPQFTSPENGALVMQFFMLGAIFIIVALLIFSAIAYLSGAIGHWFSHSIKGQIYLNRIAGTVLAGLALKLVTTSSNA